jgi:glycerol-3-phosphate acyltransferase PlsX
MAPFTIVKGAVECARLDQIPVILAGDEPEILSIIRKLKAESLVDNKRIQIASAAISVSMDEKPSIALRKRGSSMHVVCDLVASGQACGALSAGNSGAMMAIAVTQVGRLEGVIRPAIATLMPSKKGFGIVADAGANVDCTPQMLLQFAIFGAAFAKGVFAIDNPRVGVISNGEEEGKGNDLTRAALSLIQSTDLWCEGYCEGRDIFDGEVNVFVCDGFTGNVLLKTAEGTAKFFTYSIRENIESAGALSRLGAFLMRPVFKSLKGRFDPRAYGAAPLLGLKAPVFIAHGNSDDYAIRRAIQFVARSHQARVEELIETSLSKYAEYYKA